MRDYTTDRTRRIPRSASDDYSRAAVDERRRWLQAEVGANLAALAGAATAPHAFRGNIENLIGTVEIPVGVAGPVSVHGEHVASPGE